MALHDNDILAIIDPSLQLSELGLANTDTPDVSPDGVKMAKNAGAATPIVSINDSMLSGPDIVSMIINIEEILPTIIISIKDKSGLFTSSTYPKDGDILKLWIRSVNPDFKGIRIDFRITDVASSDADGGDLNLLRKNHRIEGIMHIPGFHDEDYESFSSMTSFDTFSKIANNLSIGYASNVKVTNDKMTRMRTGQTYLSFINEIIRDSYKDDKSFFTAFVDQYYYINLVELNSRFVIDKEIETSTIARISSGDWNKGDKGIVSENMPLLFTNHPNAGSTPQMLQRCNLFNDTGETWFKHGYRNNILYYDKDKQDKIQYFIETLNTEGAGNMKILKGNDDELPSQFQRFNYIGQQESGNVHDNYLHAVISNKLNREEITKMGLDVELNWFNPNIYRYQMIPVLLFAFDAEHKAIATKDPIDPNYEAMYDKELSGYYVVGGMKYHYTNGYYTTSAKLLRREWQKPPVDNNNNANTNNSGNVVNS